MSRIHRLRRHRSGTSSAAHDRARGLAAERLDGPLQRADDTWLAGHLAACHACRAVARAYESDRLALRGLRDRAPEPPRDLWARTSAAIESERGGARRRPSRGPSRRRGPALGVLSGIAVIAVVIGASVMSGGWLNSPATVAPAASQPAIALASATVRPGPTPIAVDTGSVGYVGTAADGRFAYNVASVKEVCPAERKPDCAEVGEGHSRHVDLTVRPKSISQSPVRNEAVVVGTDGSGSDSVYVISLPTPEPSATPVPTPTATPTVTPSPTPTPTVTPSPTATPNATSTPSAAPIEPSTAPSPSTQPSIAVTAAPASATPVPTASPTATPEPTVIPTASPTVVPTPTLVANLSIVSGVKVVGQSASYSPDGSWFAFTARPSDSSAGPDIYLWRVGDDLARRITDDHASIFGSWAGDRLIGSRPHVTDATADIAATSFMIDPSTGEETDFDAPVWRPIVDPGSRWAVAWDGTVRVDPETHTTIPDKGSLVLRPYSRSGGVASAGASVAVADGPVGDFDVRWDETG